MHNGLRHKFLITAFAVVVFIVACLLTATALIITRMVRVSDDDAAIGLLPVALFLTATIYAIVYALWMSFVHLIMQKIILTNIWKEFGVGAALLFVLSFILSGDNVASGFQIALFRLAGFTVFIGCYLFASRIIDRWTKKHLPPTTGNVTTGGSN